MPIDPEQAAELAGLTYVTTDETDGYTRKRQGRGFAYYDSRGRLVRSPALRDRLKRLAIPPAWKEVWICPDPEGHILATGRDDANRKQYIYHPRWNEVRKQAMYHDLVDFAESLPQIRGRIQEDLEGDPAALRTVLALGVRLLDETLVRVGNECYARENGSRGLTTLEKQHVKVEDGAVILEFPGKSGVDHSLEITDPELAELLEDRLRSPTERLLAWRDGDVMRPLTAQQVNEYIGLVSRTPHTAKAFRTWGGTVMATHTFLGLGPCPDTGRARTAALAQALDQVALRLGNTRAVARAHYVHPGVIDAYADGRLEELARQRVRLKGLSGEERVTLGVLRQLRSDSPALVEAVVQASAI